MTKKGLDHQSNPENSERHEQTGQPGPSSSAPGHSSIGQAGGENAEILRKIARAIRAGAPSDEILPEPAPAREHLIGNEQSRIRDLMAAGAVVSVEDAALEPLQILSNRTSEHEVRQTGDGLRVIKRTWAGVYGQVPVWEGNTLLRHPATPSEYLIRQALQNETFGSEIRFDGVNVSDKPSMILFHPAGEPSFVVSQPFLVAADPNNASPAAERVAEFMQDEGFVEVTGSYFGWVRPADGIAVVDAKPDNFILTEEGVVPIDLQMAQLPEAVNYGLEGGGTDDVGLVPVP